MLLEHWSDEVVDISDNGANDWMEIEHENGRTELRYNGDHVARSRLRVDTRKWLLSKLKPGTYGDKVQHSGPDGGAIAMAHSIEFNVIDPNQDQG